MIRFPHAGVARAEMESGQGLNLEGILLDAPTLKREQRMIFVELASAHRAKSTRELEQMASKKGEVSGRRWR